jgi:hypothetical protein
MSGLYTRFNLSEQGLNFTEAVQKLYASSIQDDINLFAFSSKLVSSIKSPDQLIGFINEPETRTKFLTTGFTFSNGNRVWIESAPSSLTGITLSRNGSVPGVRVIGKGLGYSVSGPVTSYPVSVNVVVKGVQSLSRNCILQVQVNSNGSISEDVEIVNPGSGYIIGEELQLLPACDSGENPETGNCSNYTSPLKLTRDYSQGYPASIVVQEYEYIVVASSRTGFFLYDEKTQQIVNFGSEFNSFVPATDGITIKRRDIFSSESFANLYLLNGRSLFYSYNVQAKGNNYRASVISETNPEESISLGEEIGSISDQVEALKSDFPLYIQNSATPRSEFDIENQLGYRYNIVSGFNLTCNYRTIFRDPDKVLQEPDVSFLELSSMSGAEDFKIDGKVVPGIWIFNGDKYQRIFSSDSKPFISRIGRKYLSPRLYEFPSEEESEDFRYSVNTSYYNPITETVLGFDFEVTTLVQNISQSAENGGFVYHRTLSSTLLNPVSGLRSWPLFSYKDSNGTIKNLGVLSV